MCQAGTPELQSAKAHPIGDTKAPEVSWLTSPPLLENLKSVHAAAQICQIFQSTPVGTNPASPCQVFPNQRTSVRFAYQAADSSVAGPVAPFMLQSLSALSLPIPIGHHLLSDPAP